VLRRLSDGPEIRVKIPEGVGVGNPQWAPGGDRFAFTVTRPDGIELWVGETASGEARALTQPSLNAVPGTPFQWLPGGRRLVVRLIPDGRGPVPTRPALPGGPNVQETSGRTAPVRTYQDLLDDPHDEALFDHYFTSQLAVADVEAGGVTKIGRPAVYDQVYPAPGGEFLVVSRTVRPYSYLVPSGSFPEIVEIWDLEGKVVKEVARLPLREEVPIEGVPTGPRDFRWRSTADAALFWVEALDGGDPRNKVAHRDRVMVLEAPFVGEPREVLKTEHRFRGLSWLERGGLALASEFDRDRRWSRTWLVDVDSKHPEPRLVWDRSVKDRYGDPGTPVSRPLPSGREAVLVREGAIYLTGGGATPEGDRPFLDRLDLANLKTERLWRCEGTMVESVVDLLADDASLLLLRHESQTEPPNYLVLDRRDGSRRPVTDFKDPAPELRMIKKELVTYSRADGVKLSATLYLPPDHKVGQRRPVVLWAYPEEFNDPATAGQVSGSPHRFTMIAGTSHLFLLLAGYVLMDGASMPVVGPPEKANDTYVEQIVTSARAAIDKADALGVGDKNRAGVGGHSYGAFMTANLLAHSDLFKAGVARSGAYNRTLTPFGFQNERRTFWEAKETYVSMSPFSFADRIRTPILLIHGELDNNPGTFPIQSERLYHAIKGHGGPARLVLLPYESHGYRSKESVMHVLAEMIEWFDRHLKSEG
jgi:dipeptidyl aminopeptidase/acylaminoacyl peptidase